MKNERENWVNFCLLLFNSSELTSWIAERKQDFFFFFFFFCTCRCYKLYRGSTIFSLLLISYFRFYVFNRSGGQKEDSFFVLLFPIWNLVLRIAVHTFGTKYPPCVSRKMQISCDLGKKSRASSISQILPTLVHKATRALKRRGQIPFNYIYEKDTKEACKKIWN